MRFGLILFACCFIFSDEASVFDSPLTLYNIMKVLANRAAVIKPLLFKNCGDDPSWYSMVYTNNPYTDSRKLNETDRRSFVRRVAENVWKIHGNESMFIAAFNEYNQNISVFAQASGDLNEWATIFVNLEKFSFGCQYGAEAGYETGVYVIKRPSQEDIDKMKRSKLDSFATMVKNQQDFKDLIKSDPTNACANDAFWKNMTRELSEATSEIDFLNQLVTQTSDGIKNNILAYAYSLKNDPQPKNTVVAFVVDAGAKRIDWQSPLQQSTKKCQHLRSVEPFYATGIGLMKMQ